MRLIVQEIRPRELTVEFHKKSVFMEFLDRANESNCDYFIEK